MTGGSNPEVVAEQPFDMFEALADQTVDYNGYTVSVRELKGLCPLPPDDPRMTLEASNAWMIDFANTTQMIIPAEYAEPVTKLANRRGIEERQYTFTAQAEAKSQPIELPRPIQSTTETTSVPSAMSIEDVRAPNDFEEATVWSRETEAEHMNTVIALAREQFVIQSATDNEIALPTKEVTLPAPLLPQPSVRPAEITLGNGVSNEVPYLATAEAIPTEIELSPSAYTPASLQSIEEVSIPPRSVLEPSPLLSAVEMVDYPLMIQPEKMNDEKQVESTEWLPLLQQEPGVVLQATTEAFSRLVEYVEDEASNEPLREMVTLTVEKIAALSESDKPAVAELVQNILGAVHGIEVLKERVESPEVVALIQEKLQGLCRELLDALEIPYTEAIVADFALLLQSPEFRQLLTGTQDVEKMGTHEIKKLFKKYAPTATSQDHPSVGWLGMVAFFKSPAPILLMVR